MVRARARMGLGIRSGLPGLMLGLGLWLGPRFGVRDRVVVGLGAREG